MMTNYRALNDSFLHSMDGIPADFLKPYCNQFLVNKLVWEDWDWRKAMLVLGQNQIWISMLIVY